MAWMPGATHLPYPTPGRAKRRKGRGVAYHVAVSEQESLRPFPGADWHFYVSRAGRIYQFVDTEYQAWTTGSGNSTMIGVETQGGVRNVETEPWSDAQLTALAKIARWAHETEGVPLRLMRNSLPSEKGLGWHKLGCDPWRVPGGEKWSSAYGKVCPGKAKIAQMPEVLRRALGSTASNEEDEMNDTEKRQLKEVHEVLREGNWFRGSFTFTQEMDNIANAVAGSRDWARKASAGVEGVLAQNAALVEVNRQLVTAVASAGGVDGEQLMAHISTEVDRAMESFRARVAEGYDVRLQPKTDS